MQKIILAIIVFVALGGVAFAELQPADASVQGYMSAATTNHNGMIADTAATCTFPDGSTQVQTRFQLDNSPTLYPSCIRLQGSKN